MSPIDTSELKNLLEQTLSAVFCADPAHPPEPGVMPARIELQLREPDDAFSITLREDGVDVLPSTPDRTVEPGCIVIKAHAEDVPKFVAGELDPEEAILSGRLDLVGDLRHALELASYLDKRSAA